MISVIVIGKNEGERLSTCLKSIKDALGVLSHEVLYVDSRSTDDSLDRAHAMGARCFRLNAEDTTAGLGRFVGAKEARGEYLLFLDGDMQLQRGFAERALMAIATKDCHAVCGIREDVYMKDGQEVGRNPNYFGCTQERICPEFGGALFVASDALQKAGGWACDTIACEEAELHARLLDAKCKIAEIPAPMILHTDVQRDNRGILSTVFSKRRLGEGQALRCAMAQKKGKAYIHHEKRKFQFFLLDLLAVLLALLVPAWGPALFCLIEFGQLGFMLARRQPRAFVSQKLFFFGMPLGLLTYKVRSREYTAL